MLTDRLVRDLHAEISTIPLIDPHSHIDPRRPTARNLDDILGYHYYTELAHSSGMDKAPLADNVPPRQRVEAILGYLDRIDNTAQYAWFLDICRTFLGFRGERIGAGDTAALWDAAERVLNQPDWEAKVLAKTNVEKIFLTNDFDDPLEDFDANRYVPCFAPMIVFHLDKPAVRERLAKATIVEATDAGLMRQALGILFQRFTQRGAKACAISLPPHFAPSPVFPEDLSTALGDLYRGQEDDAGAKATVAHGVFWMLAELCREFKLPFDLMIGVNRKVYPEGVYQGQDLFDQRTSLLQYAELFNAFPEVIFPISVLTSAQNQELVSYSWIFPNVITNGHWWYSNIPTFIERDARARLQAVPKTKQLGYYSDAYKLEFVLKFNMYRGILAQILADDFVRPGVYSERQAIELARLLVRENTQRIFAV